MVANDPARPLLRWGRSVGLLLVIVLVSAACGTGDARYEVVLDGLNEPRGLMVQSDGTLCVAEAGRLAEGQQVKAGPTANRSETGSVSCVNTDGARSRIVEQLPYVFYNGTGVSTGPADISEMDGDLYLLTGEGEGQLSRTLLRITDPTTPPQVVVDFLAFAIDTAQPDFFDEINIISNPFAMIPDPGNARFLVTDGATGQVLAAGLAGAVQVFSAVEGHEVLTGIARGPDGMAYVTSFSELPHAAGDGSVLRLFPDGSFAVAADNLTAPIDLAFDTAGRMYVLEFIDDTTTNGPYRGTTGRLIRLVADGDGWAADGVLVQGLPFPTALLIDDDRIYISVYGALSSPNSGLVMRFDDLVQQASSEPPIRFAEGSP